MDEGASVNLELRQSQLFKWMRKKTSYVDEELVLYWLTLNAKAYVEKRIGFNEESLLVLWKTEKFVERILWLT